MEQEPVVLLTGASSGLGLAISQLLLQRRFRLVLTARASSLIRFAQLGIAESDRVAIRALDVADDSQRNAVIDEIRERWGGVDVLINNAAFAYRSVIEHVEPEELAKQMEVNFIGPMAIARLCLPGMRAKRAGKIINVSSVGGMMAMPTMGIYCASKFALEGASEALYYEVKPWKISVTLIEPGFINSDSFKNVRYTTQSNSSIKLPEEPYYGHYHFMSHFIARTMGISPSTPSRVAASVLKVIDTVRPALRVPGTPEARFFDLARRFLPRALYHFALYHGLPHADCWGDVSRLERRCKIELDKRVMKGLKSD